MMNAVCPTRQIIWFTGFLIMATGLLGAAQAAPKDRAPSKPNAAGEYSGSWIDTPEGQEADAIMQRTLRGEISNEEFVRLREAWRQKWIEGKGATALPAQNIPDVKLRK